MGEFSIAHLLILTLILLIFFGPSRLPALGQSIGKAIKGFKQGLSEIDTEAKDVGPQSQLNENKTGMNANQTVDQKNTSNKS
ncbi:MAG: twin-arginine translocase TatA/TatE family subunit [Pseudobdellovibrio sp.]